MKYSYEDAKQKVAEKYGFGNWQELVEDLFDDTTQAGATGLFNEYYREVSEFMAMSWSNEAVKERYDLIMENCTFEDKGFAILLDVDGMRKLPLPYPELP